VSLRIAVTGTGGEAEPDALSLPSLHYAPDHPESGHGHPDDPQNGPGLLQRASDEDPVAFDAVFPVAHEQLRGMPHRRRRENIGHTLGAREYPHVEVEGDKAQAVALERSGFQSAAADTTSAGYTRATHIFGRQEGEWKTAQRHMDHIVGAPPTPGP
jgi:hypothetical protein